MDDQSRSLLVAGMNQLGLDPPGSAIDSLIAYHDLLMDRNQSLNLTGHKDPAESVTKNLLNSLGPWRHVVPTHTTADIGTGAGLPGIPLAIILGMKELLLVESKAKKCRFLEEACRMAAPGVRVLCMDANELRSPVTQVIASGFGTLEKLAHVTRFSRTRDARILAWKGKIETIRDEIEEASSHRIRWEVVPFDVPGLDSERHICIGTS